MKYTNIINRLCEHLYLNDFLYFGMIISRYVLNSNISPELNLFGVLN